MNLFNATYDSQTKILYGTHISGFYSCINCTRISLYTLVSQGILPDQISLVHTLHWYKDNPFTDYYPLLYSTNLDNKKNIITNFDFESFCPTQKPHNELQLNHFFQIENTYFLPSNSVIRNIDKFIKKYNIQTENTLAVLHRGNDKWKETQLSPVEEWISVIESKYEDGMKILIQTDEEYFKQQFIQYFGDRCFTFDEMIFNNTRENNIRPVTNKQQWALNFETVMRIISKCKYIINHTGNCALVPIVYRGNTQGEVQIFNREIKYY